MRKRMAGQAQRLRDVAARLENGAAERKGTDQRFLRRERYGAWRHQTKQAVADARGLLNDKDLAPHFEEDPALRRSSRRRRRGSTGRCATKPRNGTLQYAGSG